MISPVTTSGTIPRQKISQKDKTDEWHIDCAKAYINMSSYNRTNSKQNVRKLYDYYAGKLLDDDYTFIENRYAKAHNTNFPSRLRNYPIIKPVVDLLLGEKTKRPFSYSVVNINGNSVTEKEQAKNKLVLEAIKKKFLKNINEMSGGELANRENPPSAEIPVSSIVKDFEHNYRDAKAIIGQKSMNYLIQDLRLKEMFEKQFFNFLVTGEVYSHKSIANNEVVYESISATQVDYDVDSTSEYVEDGDWALIRQKLSLSTVLDRHSDKLSDTEIDRLERPRGSDLDFSLFVDEHNHISDDRDRTIEVITLYWKSYKKVGFRYYFSEETNALEEEVVNESYKAQDNEIVEWEWKPEIRRAIVLDSDIYVGLGIYEDPRRSIDNPGSDKLPINGRKYITHHTENTSIVKLGIPYQIQYNIYKYRLELAIAKSKDVVGVFSLDMIPKKWTTDKFMYHLEGTGIAWVSYNKENAHLSSTHQSVIDLSIKTINQYIDLLESIVAEWERVSGVSQQRQGQIGPYETVSGSQQSIIQSSHITEDYFAKFDYFVERELQGLLDNSKIAWINGKKSSYVMPDGTIEYLTIDPIEYAFSELGIFVRPASAEKDKIDYARSLTQPMLQNGYKASNVLEILESDNFAEIKSKIKTAEKLQDELNQKLAEAQAEGETAKEQAQLEREKELINAKNAVEYDKIEAGILMKTMELESKKEEREGSTSEDRDKLKAEVDKIREEIRKSRDESKIERDKLKLSEKEMNANKEIALKKIQADKQKAIAANKKAAANNKK